MSIVISAAELKGVVKRVAVAGGEKTILHFHNGEVGSSNLALSIITKCEALQAGDVPYVAVDTRQLHDVVSKFKKGNVELRVDNNYLFISSETASFTLPTAQAGEVVINPSPSKITMPRAAFIDLLMFAANAAETKQRFNYTGSLDIKPYGPGNPVEGVQNIVAVGTDGCRLAVAEAMLPVSVDFEFLLPVQVLKALKELAGSDLMLSQTDNAIFVESPTTRIMASKTTKQFPSFDKFLITAPKFKAEIKAAFMREALDRVSAMVSNDAKSVLLQFNDGRLRLTTGVGLTGKATDEVAFDIVIPDPVMDDPIPFEVRLNHGHLRDFFADAKGTVTFTATTSSQPVWLECEGKKLLAATVGQ